MHVCRLSQIYFSPTWENTGKKFRTVGLVSEFLLGQVLNPSYITQVHK